MLPWPFHTFTDVLTDDPHLAPFLSLPAKENGFDIEGLAVQPSESHWTVFLGLRGPVLAGFALVLELKLSRDGPKLRLNKQEDKSLYLKHAVALRGLGIRDLAFRDEQRK